MRTNDIKTISGLAVSDKAKQGMTLVNLRNMGIYPTLVGAERPRRTGYNAAGDIITQTTDGFDLNQIWDEFQAAIAIQNEERSKIVSLLTFPVTQNIERVGQVSSAKFERASEYGEPVGARPAGEYLNLGYDFYWYDLAARFTWKFLADAPASQIQAIHSMALEADNQLIFGKVMDALYNNTNRVADINDQEVNVYALYNGDGTVPPAYKTNTFDGTHSHYMTSGATTLTSEDVDDLYEQLRHHGYSHENGYGHLLLVNETQAKDIRKFRVADGASWDFIPATGQPGLLLPADQRVFGNSQPASTYAGLNVQGRYGNFLIVVDDMFPSGYVAAVATGGEENLGNPVGFRQHANASLQGMRLVKGRTPDYPLIDSFYNRGFGTGIRQRGGAAIMQVTASTTYTPPVFAV